MSSRGQYSPLRKPLYYSMWEIRWLSRKKKITKLRSCEIASSQTCDILLCYGYRPPIVFVWYKRGITSLSSLAGNSLQCPNFYTTCFIGTSRKLRALTNLLDFKRLRVLKRSLNPTCTESNTWVKHLKPLNTANSSSKEGWLRMIGLTHHVTILATYCKTINCFPACFICWNRVYNSMAVVLSREESASLVPMEFTGTSL